MAANYHTSFSSSVDFGTNVHHHHRQPMVKQFSSSVSCNNSSSTWDHESQMNMVIQDRKHRRMISNRESARRSRMRKQRQLEELCTQVVWLKNQNHGLLDQLNRFLESQKQVIQENRKLKKETLELRKLLSEAQLATTYTGLGDIGFFRDLDDDGYLLPSCTTVQSSHETTVSSANTNDSSTLLH
ncbi:basic leucine zipper 43-like [Cynara cardunculus var. scolymus]|uniref:Basic-leucine zipper domain-containing protein n=1 Tax=Cynara cardunculus var. scolymus TaxID=59895 RepID=A0A103YA63_CYNCS|nr:basic leucine zipper 43-like [Cynara cardunculus var. scolymus]KVI05305.1 Basic-leucine zipper domain-containing protein [Cynara cardunculus var. scolymus]